jgi:hypothetical protein
MYSIIPDKLKTAYQNTDYIVLFDEREIVLRINEFSASLNQLHTNFAAQSSAFITAYNPYSKIYSMQENKLRQDQLEKELKLAGFFILAGIGQDPAKQWPGEPAFLIIGISLNDARALGKKYKQNAIVFSQQDAVPKLEYLW